MSRTRAGPPARGPSLTTSGRQPKEVATVTDEVVSRRCGEPPPPDLRIAVAQFNRGEFWECHETLERLWLAEPEPLRVLYKGILHLGVGFLHLRNRNRHGAVTKLSSGIQMLEPFGQRCLGVEVGKLVQEATTVLKQLEGTQADDLGNLARARPPKLGVRSNTDAAG